VLKYTTERMSNPAYKKRRIMPKAGYGTISAAAMASNVNKKVAVLQKQVRRIQRAEELKSLDTTLSFNFDATGEIPATGQLCLIPQGSADAERIGRNALVKSLQIRANVGFVPGAAATASSTAHMFIVLDRQTNQAACTVLDIFSATNVGIGMRDRANDKRFKILKHWYHTFTPTAGVSGAYNNVQYAMEIYLGKLNIPMSFTGATGAIGEITTNNIFLVAGTEGASDDTISLSGIARVTFTDGAS